MDNIVNITKLAQTVEALEARVVELEHKLEQLTAVPTNSTNSTNSTNAKPAGTFVAERLTVSVDDGKTYYKIKGGRYTQYGVRIWPEVLEASGIDPNTIDIRQPPNIRGYTAVLAEVDGEHLNVIKLIPPTHTQQQNKEVTVIWRDSVTPPTQTKPKEKQPPPAAIGHSDEPEPAWLQRLDNTPLTMAEFDKGITYYIDYYASLDHVAAARVKIAGRAWRPKYAPALARALLAYATLVNAGSDKEDALNTAKHTYKTAKDAIGA